MSKKKNIIKKVDKMGIKADADKIFSNNGKINPSDVIKLMKKSGLSYKQIAGSSMGLMKTMNKEKAKVESEGKYFDEKAYLNGVMNQATQK